MSLFGHATDHRMHDLFEAHLHHYLPDPRQVRKDVSAGTAGLITHMMEKRPDKRHSSYEDLILEIEELMDVDSAKLSRRGITTGIVKRLKGLIK